MARQALSIREGGNRVGLIAAGSVGWPASLRPGLFAGLVQTRSERVSAAAIVIVLHATVAALVLIARPAQSSGETPGLMAFDLPSTGASEPHRHIAPARHARVAPAVPTPLLQVAMVDLDSLRPALSPAVLMTADVALPETSPASGCNVLQPVQDALRSDAAVRQQLPTIPVARRSVANAIAVWNQGWIMDDAAPAQLARATIRRAITQAVAAASPACRNQLQRGPLLLFVTGSSTASGVSGQVTVLALGSGQWTWQQLLDGDKPLPQDAELVAGDATPLAFAAPQSARSAAGPSSALDAMLASLLHKRSPTLLPYNP